YRFANATWPDLIAILGTKSGERLDAWSHAWVEEPGRPTIATELIIDQGTIKSLTFTQRDPRNRGLTWNQRMSVTLGYASGDRTLTVSLSAPRVEVAEAKGLDVPLYVLPNGGGIAYGQMELDDRSRAYLLTHLSEVSDPLTRGSAWVTLWDELLRG